MVWDPILAQSEAISPFPCDDVSGPTSWMDTGPTLWVVRVLGGPLRHTLHIF